MLSIIASILRSPAILIIMPRGKKKTPKTRATAGSSGSRSAGGGATGASAGTRARGAVAARSFDVGSTRATAGAAAPSKAEGAADRRAPEEDDRVWKFPSDEELFDLSARSFAHEDSQPPISSTRAVSVTASVPSNSGKGGGDKLEYPSDEELFQTPPPNDDCPICFIRLPSESDADKTTGVIYQSCCGQTLCLGCAKAVEVESAGKLSFPICPFCRTPEAQTHEELAERLRKRMATGDAHGFHGMGLYHYQGEYAPHDKEKALELLTRAAELGLADAHWNLAAIYGQDNTDAGKERMWYHRHLAAIKGHRVARYYLGVLEAQRAALDGVGSCDAKTYCDRAIKHFTIAAETGCQLSLKCIRDFSKGGELATKADYEKALRSFQKYAKETSSDQRDKAIALEEQRKRFLGKNTRGAV